LELSHLLGAFMKNLRRLFSIFIVAVIIVCAMAACDLLDNLGGDSSNSGSGNNSNPTTVAVTGVSLKSATSLVVGGTETLYAAIDPPNASNQNVTWNSSNSSVATVSANGTVTAVAAGIASITVTTVDGNKTSGCNVSVVTSPVAVTGVALNKSSTSLNTGSAETLVPIITPSGATNQNLTWASSDAYIATVSAGGLVTAVAAGTATITVTTVDGNKTATCNVTVTGSATPTFTSVAAFETWLNAQSANTANTAYNVALNLSSLDGLNTVLNNTYFVYVSLNLSGSTFTSIGKSTFSGCPLTSITIPNCITSIESDAFYQCRSLTAINVASANNSFTAENGVLYNKNKTTLICYPGGKPGSFNIPESVTSIGDYAFSWCTDLTGVTISNGVTSIGEKAFSYCTNLTSITIPASITSIGVFAFFDCYSLTSVTFQGTIAFDKYEYVFPGDLCDKYLTGGIGTYITTAPMGLSSVWTKSGGGGNVAPGGTYIITGSSMSFTATNGGATIGTGAIQNVINAIRTHAAGTNSTIQFGNGTTTLDIGEENVRFNNSGGTWGAVKLTGKITSVVSNANSGTIYIDDSVSITSAADIANSAENGNAIWHKSTGTLSITGGTVSVTSGDAVCNYYSGAVTISGGTVSATSGCAVVNNIYGAVNITGGTVLATSGNAVYGWAESQITVSGTARVTSANKNTIQGTICIFILTSTIAVNTSLEIIGGTVENTSTGNAVIAPGVVSITGGTVSATSGIAVYGWSTDTFVSITVSGTARVTSANKDTEQGTIYLGRNIGTATNTRLEITGGMVENTSTTTGNAVRNDSSGAISVTGGTVSKAGDGNYAVYKSGTGAVTIGAGATIVGNKYGL
jgi:hypothetical protein